MTFAEMGEFLVTHWLTLLLGAVTAGLATGYLRLAERMREDRAVNLAVHAGIMALIANRMIQLYAHYSEEGYCPADVRKSAEVLYCAYHVLGGNGIITDIYRRILALPVDKPKEV